MTSLLKYLLPLCLFISSGFSQLEVRAIEQTVNYFSAENTSFSTTSEEAAFRVYNHGENGQRSPIGFEQEEEDETETSREDSISNDASNTSYTSNFVLGVQKHLTLRKYVTYLPSYKSLYILFEVFRI